MKSYLIVFTISFFCLFQGAEQAISQKPRTVLPDFKRTAEHRLGRKISSVCAVDTDETARRLFAEYGAVFIAGSKVALPPKCIFTGEDDLGQFQAAAGLKTIILDGVPITLQGPAMGALLKAREKAAEMGLKITPRGGSLAGGRSYADTRALWDTRFLPGLDHWVRKGKLKKSEAEAARLLSTEDQVAQVLEWEETRQVFFSKDLSKSILYSVAAPGASQHNFLLAFDVQQFADERVRAIMAEFGWFQTIKSDLPHFTYLGREENELPYFGLKQVVINKQRFWIPDLK
ncbi:MAG TPA: hypothetical protein VGO50_02125 [Pyrinomonadaceae bacterium]|jgi:hypothetical protein|nr:hypothetical protein [Pyrinomonadaceae bacterium]